MKKKEEAAEEVQTKKKNYNSTKMILEQHCSGTQQYCSNIVVVLEKVEEDGVVEDDKISGDLDKNLKALISY